MTNPWNLSQEAMRQHLDALKPDSSQDFRNLYLCQPMPSNERGSGRTTFQLKRLAGPKPGFVVWGDRDVNHTRMLIRQHIPKEVKTVTVVSWSDVAHCPRRLFYNAKHRFSDVDFDHQVVERIMEQSHGRNYETYGELMGHLQKVRPDYSAFLPLSSEDPSQRT